jgi:hypothetical protein
MEAQLMAIHHPEITATFRLSRQEKELQTGTTKLQETSLPSLVMLLNRPLLQTDRPEEIYQRGRQIVFTRSNRLDALSLQEQSYWKPLERGVNFAVYEVVKPEQANGSTQAPLP